MQSSTAQAWGPFETGEASHISYPTPSPTPILPYPTLPYPTPPHPNITAAFQLGDSFVIASRYLGLGSYYLRAGFVLSSGWFRVVLGLDLSHLEHFGAAAAAGSSPRKALRGGIPKSIFKRPCQFLAINAHTMAPRTTHWLQERHCDAATKGLAW